jgi:LacI family transcriptional regulator
MTLTFTATVPAVEMGGEMARRITIKDVAREAGVSPQTVSRAINDKGEIRPETQERILRIAKRLGYRPNRIARSLATRRSRNVGLVVPDVSNPFFASVARGIEDAAQHAGYNVFLCNTDENAAREIQAIHSLEAQRVDGLLVCSSRLSERELNEVADRFEPLVLVNRRIDRPQTGCVIVDDAKGMQQAVRHLLALGHRQIGLLAGPMQSHSGRERVKGYRQAMQAYGIRPPQDLWQIHCAPQLEGGEIAARQLLQRAPELTALVGYNDLVAIGALHACAEKGLRVPEDCAVVGCDDVLLAGLVSPALTTIHIPTYALGKQAMDLLLEMIEGDPGRGGEPTGGKGSGHPPARLIVSPHLVLRDSVSEPRQVDDPAKRSDVMAEGSGL